MVGVSDTATVVHLRNLEGAGGNRRLSHGSFNVMAKIFPWDYWAVTLANRDTIVLWLI